MKYLLTIFLSLFIFSVHSKNKCSKDDHEWAKSLCKAYDYCYDPEQMYQLGLDIQEALRKKDIEKLYSDLGYAGLPRKKTIIKKGFDAAFDKEVVDSILNTTPPCMPRKENWFYMSGRNGGTAWWTSEGHIQEITSNDIEEYEEHIEWIHKKNIINPSCFTSEWQSSDNYEEYEEKYLIKNIKDFRKNPGNYFGGKVPLEAIDASWGNEKVYLARDLEVCNFHLSNKDLELEINENFVKSKMKDRDYYNSYRILRKLSKKNCKKFAPNINGNCLSAYLIETGNYRKYNFYGIFQLNNNNKEYMVPLKNFYGQISALNFIDELEEKSQ